MPQLEQGVADRDAAVGSEFSVAPVAHAHQIAVGGDGERESVVAVDGQPDGVPLFPRGVIRRQLPEMQPIGDHEQPILCHGHAVPGSCHARHDGVPPSLAHRGEP